jgi:cytochrome P450
MGFTFAGMETTAATCIDSFYYLALHPEWQEKIRKEFQAVISDPNLVTLEILKNLPLLNAFVNEVLRVIPPGSKLLPRRMTKDAKLSGWLQAYKKYNSNMIF